MMHARAEGESDGVPSTLQVPSSRRALWANAAHMADALRCPDRAHTVDQATFAAPDAHAENERMARSQTDAETAIEYGHH